METILQLILVIGIAVGAVFATIRLVNLIFSRLDCYAKSKGEPWVRPRVGDEIFEYLKPQDVWRIRDIINEGHP